MSPSTPLREGGPARPRVPAAAGTVLVTGGTGFIGGAVVRELLRAGDEAGLRPRIRVLARRPVPAWMAAAGVERVAADLREPRTLRGCCRGVAAVLHLAGYVGRDPARCTAVNAAGTGALLDEAVRAGNPRIVYVSTASVYGSGPHRGPDETALAPSPASAASASRLVAEEAVRGGDGIVLRPNLVYGPGDRWFVPALVRLLREVPVWPDGGSARSSLIAVQDLARVVAALAGAGAWQPAGGSVWHVNHPEPVSLRTLAQSLCRALGLPEPRGDLPYAGHRALAAKALPELTDHQHALLTRDHWYDSGRIWDGLGLDPGPGLRDRLAESTPWYLQHLAGPGGV